MGGVEPQSETVWRQADKYRVPRIAFVNKMDRAGADFEHAIDMMRTRLRANPVCVQWPIGKEDKFEGVIDLIEEKALVFKDETLGAEFTVAEIPDELKEEVAGRREKLIEAASEADEVLFEKFVNGVAVTVEDLKAGVRQATIDM